MSLVLIDCPPKGPTFGNVNDRLFQKPKSLLMAPMMALIALSTPATMPFAAVITPFLIAVHTDRTVSTSATDRPDHRVSDEPPRSDYSVTNRSNSPGHLIPDETERTNYSRAGRHNGCSYPVFDVVEQSDHRINESRNVGNNEINSSHKEFFDLVPNSESSVPEGFPVFYDQHSGDNDCRERSQHDGDSDE